LLVPLIATAPCEYDGKRYAIGASFSAYSEDHAKVLVLLGKARHGEPDRTSEPEVSEPARPKRVYRRRAVAVQDPE
jgi:hypothetical protein